MKPWKFVHAFYFHGKKLLIFDQYQATVLSLTPLKTILFPMILESIESDQ